MMRYDKIYKSVMKTAGSLFAVAMMTFTSACSDEGYDLPSLHDVKICFESPVVDGISRANVPDYEYNATTPFHKDERIMVFGYHYGKDLTDKKAASVTDNATVEYGTGAKPGEVASYDPSVNAWDTQEHHYWNPEQFYYFAAYSPSDLSSNATTVERTKGLQNVSELQVTGYQTPAIGNQFDFMFSETVYEVEGPTPKVDENGNTFYNGVNLRFRHALSSIHFNVRLDPDYVKDIDEKNREHEASQYKIKNIVLSGVYDKADFTEHAGFTYDNTTSHNTYQFNPNNKANWTKISGKNGYKSNKATYDFVSKVSPINNIPYKLEGNDIKSKDIKELNNKAHIGFMIPQKLTDKAKVVVTWTYNDITDISKEIYLNNVSKNPVMTTEWLMGKRYIYTLTISNDFIDFEPSAGGWNDETHSF